MAEPIIVSGGAVNDQIDDFSGYRVTALFYAPVVDADAPAEAEGGAVPEGAEAARVIEMRRVALLEPGGEFRLELPPAGEWERRLHLVVTAPSGLPVGTLDLDDVDDVDDVEIPVSAQQDPVVVEAADDPSLGGLPRFTGRVIDAAGNPQRAGLLVVLWGTPAGDGERYPLALSETASGGYFAGAWPSDVLTEAAAVVAGAAAVPIPLDGGRLPRNIIVVVEEILEGASRSDTMSPPRAPSAEDLARNGEAFSSDVSGCSLDFTVPNRTVEEMTYQALVRTTQPAIKGASVPPRPKIPGRLLDRITELAAMRPAFERSSRRGEDVAGDATGVAGDGYYTARSTERLEREQPAETPRALVRLSEVPDTPDERAGEAVSRVMRMANAIDVSESATMIRREGRAEAMLAARNLEQQPLRLESSVLAELAREPGEVSPARLVAAERTSLVRRFRSGVHLLAGAPVDRFELDPARQVDWDDVPYAYQASTIAHGHILTFKQVWRADGYSLGDLLYSLPLAPGQQKLVSILDWDRREQAVRQEQRRVTEEMTADLAHDRDISDIVRASVSERMDGSSRANTAAVGAAIGGFIGPVVFGAAGGVSNASSSARQTSARDVTASSLNSARDRTMQAASAVRGQRTTVVQTARQGESVRAQTEAIANNNHGHALTVEYFEVLRHFQVSQELAGVQECLFIPFVITAFSDRKAYQWRDSLRTGLRKRPMHSAMAALERVVTDWEDADYPDGRYADEVVNHIDGDLWLTISLPRPADNDDDTFNAANWTPYTTLLGGTAPQDVWERYLGVALPKDRAHIWNTRIAPGIVKRLLDHLKVELRSNDGAYRDVPIDTTLVTSFRQNARLLVTFRPNGALPTLSRAVIQSVRFSFGVTVPAAMEAIVRTGSLRYRTDHFTWWLMSDYSIDNDIGASDQVEVMTPLNRREKVAPKARDRRMAEELIDHLNEHVEYYHRVIWLNMDPNRRYMLLDGVIAPDAGGRSVASVVENRVIGVIGNSLVMPVVPGLQLDPTYEFADDTPADLVHLYAADPPPPVRISVPTRGVFAEAALGKCNSNEIIDDTRFWRWEEAPIPDSPTAIAPLSLDSRRQTPANVTPSPFTDGVVRYQDVPSSPDPTGLAASLELLGTKDLFKNLTGLALNQENSAAALKSVMTAAQSFASQGAALAQQRYLNGQMDRGLDLIKKARDSKQITPDQAETLSESLFRGAMGEKRPTASSTVDSSAVRRTLERVADSESGELRITRPSGTVEVKTNSKTTSEGIDVSIDGLFVPVEQPSNMTCWATAGAMLRSWQTQTSMTIESVLDGLGGGWRAKFDANQGLSGAELNAFVTALGLSAEGPMSYSVEGLARLLREEGPLWVVSDDQFEANNIVHVRIVTAMKGNGTPDGTTVTLADSGSGTFVTEPFTEFARRLEASDAVNFGAGIYHF